MNLTDPNYAQYALVQEMMQTVETVEKFDPAQTVEVAKAIIEENKTIIIKKWEDFHG